MDYGKAIKHATNQMNRRMDAYAKQYDLTGTQMSILDFISGQAHVLQRDIEAEFNIQRSSATVTLQRMEKRGLITRTPSASDARQKEVHLTAKAKQVAAAVASYISEQQAQMIAHFSEAERATFEHMLQYFTDLNGGNHHQSE